MERVHNLKNVKNLHFNPIFSDLAPFLLQNGVFNFKRDCLPMFKMFCAL